MLCDYVTDTMVTMHAYIFGPSLYHKLTRFVDILGRASYFATLFWLPETAKAIPKSRLIQFFSAGTNHISQHPIYTDSKVPLCSANGVHGPQIAEWVRSSLYKCV
jgi:phosphoglycerate dehydrogenase-like enzyme